jgi:hypothetical protein
LISFVSDQIARGAKVKEILNESLLRAYSHWRIVGIFPGCWWECWWRIDNHRIYEFVTYLIFVASVRFETHRIFPNFVNKLYHHSLYFLNSINFNAQVLVRADCTSFSFILFSSWCTSWRSCILRFGFAICTSKCLWLVYSEWAEKSPDTFQDFELNVSSTD